MVGLFELSRPRPAAITPAETGANTGEACLVGYCPGLDEVMRRPAGGGHRVVCPPVPPERGDSVEQREMICANPAGVLVNPIQWEPDAAGRAELSRAGARRL